MCKKIALSLGSIDDIVKFVPQGNVSCGRRNRHQQIMGKWRCTYSIKTSKDNELGTAGWNLAFVQHTITEDHE
jgi:hypothetical protein